MITSQQYRPLDELKRDDLPKAPKAVADVLDEWRHREHGIIAGHHGVGLFLDLLADAGYTVTRSAAESPVETAQEPLRCLEWQQLSASYEPIAERRYCLGLAGHDEHAFEIVPPPVIHSYDPSTGAIDLEGSAGQRVLVQHSPGPLTGFTIALYAEDGPHFVHDPEAPGSWHGPLTADEANAIRNGLGKPPIQRDQEEEFM